MRLCALTVCLGDLAQSLDGLAAKLLVNARAKAPAACCVCVVYAFLCVCLCPYWSSLCIALCVCARVYVPMLVWHLHCLVLVCMCVHVPVLVWPLHCCWGIAPPLLHVNST